MKVAYNRIKYTKGEVIGNNNMKFIVEVERYESPSGKTKSRRAEFLCHCGNKFRTVIYKVVSGHTTSCGCSSKPRELKKCADCGKSEPDVEFTKSRKYNCRGCVKKRNRKYSIKNGSSERFVPIFTDSHKQCGKCKEILPLDNFSNSKKGRMGKSSWCKPCCARNILERCSKEDRRAKTQTYRDNNREWWRNLHRITQFNRRNKIKAVSDGTVTKEFIERTYDIRHCYYCKKIIPKEHRTLEHKHPLSKGGRHVATNITMACRRCNFSKGDKTEKEFDVFNMK